LAPSGFDDRNLGASDEVTRRLGRNAKVVAQFAEEIALIEAALAKLNKAGLINDRAARGFGPAPFLMES
jgi:hypothetical protein